MLSSAAFGAFAVGLAAFAFRYLTISPIENDHFVMLARAQQALYGDWPVRDFEDPGQPLFYLVKLLEEGGYDGPRHFDAHAYRTEDADGVWEFFFTAPVLKFTKAVGAPINPLAIK